MQHLKQKPVVLLACTGLGRINRGYESFTRECFEELKKSKHFELFLVKGGGQKSESEIVVKNMHRKGKLARFISKIITKDVYFIEQFTFFIGLIPILIRKKPALIYFSDFVLGTFLWQLRRFLGFKYKLLFSNGAPNGPPFTRTDHVQQLLPSYIEQACKAGTPINKQTLLPYAIAMDKSVNLSISSQYELLRKKFSLPLKKKIIISVGAINSSHKRMDYVISEFARLNHNDYFLLILGQFDHETSNIEKHAKELLSPDTYRLMQVAKENVAFYLGLSDYFILASLNEGQPRVIIEALSMGLLPIVNDYNVTRETLGDYAIYSELSKPGNLLNAIKKVDERNISKCELIEYAWKCFSWQQRIMEYEAMIIKNLS
jgi:1,2-diacylglycerol 3-alpha-glucosyltransferase